jgi:hypothetical protein
MAEDKNKISLEEFRAWLQGVEEMQEDDWAPNMTQWKKIREKIDEISSTQPQFATLPVHQPMTQGIIRHQPQPGVLMQDNEGGVIPGPSVLDTAVQTAPAEKIELNPDAPIARGQEQVKTPNIDTTDGEYKSAFA